MTIYRPGDGVYSRRFGRGEVTGIVGFGDSVQLRIRFESGEEREVLARSLDLELLSRAAAPARAPVETLADSGSTETGATAPAGDDGPATAGRAESLSRQGFLPPRPASEEPPRTGAGQRGDAPSRPSEPRPFPRSNPALSRPRSATLPSDPALRDALAQLAADLVGAAEIPAMDRWAGGEMILRPGRAGTKEKSVPLDAFFHKIVMVRDRLRVLEQKINTSPSLSDAEKVEMQQYLSRLQGSLTTFNFLFRDREDWFVGQSGGD